MIKASKKKKVINKSNKMFMNVNDRTLHGLNLAQPHMGEITGMT